MRRAVLAAALAIAAVGIVPASASASLAINADAAQVNESAGTASFTISRTGGDILFPTTVSVSATGAAGPPSQSTLTFAALDTTAQSVTIPIDDSIDESAAPRPMTVSISAQTNGPTPEGVSQSSATTQVVDDNDTTIDVAPAPVSVPEGGAATVTLTPRRAVPHPLTVQYATAPATATEADYTPTSGTLTWQPGDAQPQTITVPTTQDQLNEDDETLSLNLTPVGESISATSVPITIVDDDPLPQLSAAGTRVVEGSSGLTTAYVTVSLSAPSGRTVAVTYATRDGTAIAPSDYGGVTGRLTFAPGETSRQIPIFVNGDRNPEPGEAFALQLRDPANATLAPGLDTAAVTILNDHGTPGLPGLGATGAAKDVTPPAIRLGRLAGRGARLTLPLKCPSGETSCAGTITLFSVPTRSRPEHRLGAARFSVRGGRQRTVVLRLSRSAQAFVRAAGTLRVRAYAVAQDGAGNVGTAAVSATLRR